jgi:hypothetical protein
MTRTARNRTNRESENGRMTQADEIGREIGRVLAGYEQVRDDFAERVVSLRSYLHCSICGHSQTLNKQQARRYLARRWPQHCGRTMELTR